MTRAYDLGKAAARRVGGMKNPYPRGTKDYDDFENGLYGVGATPKRVASRPRNRRPVTRNPARTDYEKGYLAGQYGRKVPEFTKAEFWKGYAEGYKVFQRVEREKGIKAARKRQLHTVSRNPPKRRSVARNPSRPGRSQKSAIALAKAFFGKRYKPSYVSTATFDRECDVVRVGEITQINYITAAQPIAEMAHAFKKGHRAPLYVTADGSVAFILLKRGRSRFTGRGFTP